MTLLERILANGTVEDDRGNFLPLHSAIPPEEGECIRSCIQRHSFSRTLEIGCAYGISSLYICDAISKHSNAHHIIIDPFQASSWHNLGVRNLRNAGFVCWELIEQLSELALPKLLQSGATVQFALIDGYHTFDQVLIDFFYIDRLLEDGGVVTFDDAHMPAIDRVIRYVLRYPNYRLLEVGSPTDLPKSIKHRLYEFILRPVTRLIPAHNQEEYFDDRWLRPAKDIGLGGRFALLQKSGSAFLQRVDMSQSDMKHEAYSINIQRGWDWYEHF